jgi:hypothetical protein
MSQNTKCERIRNKRKTRKNQSHLEEMEARPIKKKKKKTHWRKTHVANISADP